MEHAEIAPSQEHFARIIAGFEQEALASAEQAEEATRLFHLVSDKLAEARALIGIVTRERDEARGALAVAPHKVAEKIAEACEHIHDADGARKSAFLDCARIARGVTF